MQLVVDANILITGLLRPAATRRLLLNEQLALWTPEYALLETQRILLTPRIQRKFGALRPDQIMLAVSEITGNIQVLPENSYRTSVLKAEKFAPDPADTPYFALALHLEIPVWSNDALLKNQHHVVVHTTQEVLDRIHPSHR